MCYVIWYIVLEALVTTLDEYRELRREVFTLCALQDAIILEIVLLSSEHVKLCTAS